MEFTNIKDIPSLLRGKLVDRRLRISFVQWESEDPEEDETITEFEGYFIECRVSENEFQGFDGCFHFQLDDADDITEILMDFPAGSDDIVATQEDSTIRIFGDESMLTVQIM